MTPENFCYWLQGFMELSNERTLTPEQVQSIRDHLNLVFIKLTPLACATPVSDPNLTSDFAKAIEEGRKGMKVTKMSPNYVGISRTAC